MNTLLVAALLGASVTWDHNGKDVNGQAETIVASECELLSSTQEVLATVRGGSASCGLGILVDGRAAGNYSLRVRVSDSAGNWSAWSNQLAYVVEAPKPTKIVLTYSHEGKDLNGRTITLTAAEAKIVAKGAGSGAVSLATIAAPTAPQAGVNSIECGLAALPALPGTYDAWIRVRSAAGWSGFYGPIAVATPPEAPQPAQVAPKLTTPSRPFGAKAEVKP